MKIDPVITTQDLALRLQDEHLIIVDVRFNLADKEWGREVYKDGHVPKAHYAHLDDDLSDLIVLGKTGRHPWPSISSIENLLSRFGVKSNSHVVIYDQAHGGIAARLWAICQYVGIKQVQVLNGGWQHWVAEERPVSQDVPEHVDSEFKALDPLFGIADVDSLKEYKCKVDARASKRYRGEEEPIDPIAGHIPGAINFPFLENLNDDLSWKSKDELADRFESITNQELVMYCGSGVTACHNMIAMKRAGFELPTLYPGSWSDYITDPDREIEIG